MEGADPRHALAITAANEHFTALFAGRLNSRVPATILLAIGGFIPSLTSGLSRFGFTQTFFLGELLGVVRTQELLAARRIDNAEQYFTRAIDFGYSKSAEESLARWGHEAILGDVVWVVRQFRPDVIVQVFAGSASDGHGHHQASGILAQEAFAAAGDRSRFPEQLRWVEPWQAYRLMQGGFYRSAGGPSSRPSRR